MENTTHTNFDLDRPGGPIYGSREVRLRRTQGVAYQRFEIRSRYEEWKERREGKHYQKKEDENADVGEVVGEVVEEEGVDEEAINSTNITKEHEECDASPITSSPEEAILGLQEAAIDAIVALDGTLHGFMEETVQVRRYATHENLSNLWASKLHRYTGDDDDFGSLPMPLNTEHSAQEKGSSAHVAFEMLEELLVDLEEVMSMLAARSIRGTATQRRPNCWKSFTLWRQISIDELRARGSISQG